MFFILSHSVPILDHCLSPVSYACPTSHTLTSLNPEPQVRRYFDNAMIDAAVGVWDWDCALRPNPPSERAERMFFAPYNPMGVDTPPGMRWSSQQTAHALASALMTPDGSLPLGSSARKNFECPSPGDIQEAQALGHLLERDGRIWCWGKRWVRAEDVRMGLWEGAAETAGQGGHHITLDELALWTPHADELKPEHPKFEE